MKIEYLADRLEFLHTVAMWGQNEWGRYRPGMTLEMRAEKIRRQCGRGGVPTAVVASEGDLPLGSAMLMTSDMESRPQWSPWLAGVVVAPEHRGRGIGAALVDRIVEEARAAGAPVLYLHTFVTEKFYARKGWTLVERTTHLGSEAAVMKFEI